MSSPQPQAGRRRRGTLPLRPGGDSWAGCVEEFIASERLKGRRPRTLQLHHENLEAARRDLAAAAGSDPAPATVAAEELRDLVLAWQERGLSPRSINLRRQSLRGLFSFLAAERMIEHNPAAALPRQRETRRLPRALSDQQVLALLAQPERGSFTGLRDYTMILLILDTGLRLGELLALQLRDLDFSRRAIRILEPKDRQERDVYFVDTTERALRVYLRERLAGGDSAALFISRDDTPLAPSTFQQALARYAQRAGLPRVSPHVLRHSFARLYLMNGGDVFSLQAILGHEDLEVTKIYASLWGRDVQRLHARSSPLKHLPL